MGIIKKFNNFIVEGKMEMDKIDELMDIMSKRELTSDEKDLLKRLSRGEKLPDKEKVRLVTKSSGSGYVLDDEGNPITTKKNQIDEPDKPFVTAKGKSKDFSIDVKNVTSRIYKNRNSDECYIFTFFLDKWVIYRTRITKDHPYGQFLNAERLDPKYARSTPQQMWKILDMDFDYGMEFDEKLTNDFIDFVKEFENYREKKQKFNLFNRENKKLTNYINKFKSLLL